MSFTVKISTKTSLTTSGVKWKTATSRVSGVLGFPDLPLSGWHQKTFMFFSLFIFIKSGKKSGLFHEIKYVDDFYEPTLNRYLSPKLLLKATVRIYSSRNSPLYYW